MPVQYRFGFSDGRQVILLDQTLNCDGTQIGDVQIAARLQGLRRLRRQPMPEPRRSIEDAKEYRFRRR